jgi:hypothetical protein
MFFYLDTYYLMSNQYYYTVSNTLITVGNHECPANNFAGFLIFYKSSPFDGLLFFQKVALSTSCHDINTPHFAHIIKLDF